MNANSRRSPSWTRKKSRSLVTKVDGGRLKYESNSLSITERQAVEVIAAAVYSDEDQRGARKRVRERLRFARRQGKISGAAPHQAGLFFFQVMELWPDWAALRSVDGLPLDAVVYVTGVASGTSVGQVRVLTPPANPDELLKEFYRLDGECEGLRQEVAALKARLEEAESELNARRQRESDLSQKLSAAGKRGGRGRSL